MTDYAQAAAVDPSWTWWMTTAAAAAMRMRNLRDHHAGSDAMADEFVGPNRKRQRVGHVKGEYWTNAFDDEHDDGSQTNDSAAAGPLDLSVKATVAARIIDGRTSTVDEYTPCTTPVKKHTNSTNGKSSKKTSGKTAGAGNAAAVRAATRKLLPQLDQRVDRSSPVSGTIIVPAAPEDSTNMSSQSSHYTVNATMDCGDGADRDDDYDGADIDPEFNVVVATDEARRRLESIPNALGPYRCRLCSVQYSDAFALARHRCRCIVHVRYRCPECDKVFQCPANLASHRRWHGTGGNTKTPATVNRNNKNCNDSGVQPEVIAATDNDNIVANSGPTMTTTCAAATSAAAMTAAAGFKKNMLQRAAQAAAAAAVTNHNNNNNNNNNNSNNNNNAVVDNGNA